MPKIELSVSDAIKLDIEQQRVALDLDDISSVFRKALALLRLTVDAHARGAKLVIEEPNGTRKIIEI